MNRAPKDLCNTIKHTNILRESQKDIKEKGMGIICKEIRSKISLNLMKILIKIFKKFNQHQVGQTHIPLKSFEATKDHENNTREVTNYVWSVLSKFNGKFSSETMEARRQLDDLLKVLKDKTCPTRILYLARISFSNGRRH